MNPTRLDDALISAGIKNFQYFQTIGSTNDEAFAWIADDASDFSVIVADEQTKGKGRFDRHWVTQPGSSLAFSLILKPSAEETANLPLFAPLCGLAVHDALAHLYGILSEIKWPNDILIHRKKCCGILVEADWKADQLNGLVMGIGLNISKASLPAEDGQLFPAACLEELVGEQADRYLVLEHILHQIRDWRPRLGTAEFFNHWQKYLAFKNEQVMIVQSEKTSIIGVEKGIDRQGRIVLVDENNNERCFEVGDIHLRPMKTSAASQDGGKND